MHALLPTLNPYLRLPADKFGFTFTTRSFIIAGDDIHLLCSDIVFELVCVI